MGRTVTRAYIYGRSEKIVRVGKKVIPDAPHEVLLVLDSTIGKNALSQARGFGAVAPLTGVVLRIGWDSKGRNCNRGSRYNKPD